MKKVVIIVIGLVGLAMFTTRPRLCRADDSQDRVTVVCPAIEHDEIARTSYSRASRQPVSLVVLGKIKTIKKPGGGYGIFEVAVEKVLYGAASVKTVRFTWPWDWFSNRRRIIALSPQISDDIPYDFRYVLPPEELSSQTALAGARLDHATLLSESIFIGKELSHAGEYRRKVRIVRTLHGPKLAKGDVVTMVGPHISQNDPPTICSKQMLYFIRKVAPPRRGKPVVYYEHSHIAVDQETAVRAALKRRETYPVRTSKDADGKTIKEREVTFNGTLDQAVILMGSASDAAVTLGARKLLLTGPAGRKAALADISKNLTRRTFSGEVELRRLSNLILLLGVAEKGDTDLAGLLDRMIAHIASGAPAPQRPERRADKDWHKTEADRIDTNHALLWLVRAMDMKTVVSKYAARLVRLRDGASDAWEAEIQLALVASKVLEHIELEAAFKQTAKLKPVRANLGFNIAGQQVLFSPDGKNIVADGKIYRMSGWSQTGQLKTDGACRTLFARDGKGVYVLGYNKTDVALMEYPSGKILKRFKGHKEPITSGSLSADGGLLMTASYYEDVVHIWDTTSGKIVKSYTLNEKCYEAALSPDGKTVAMKTKSRELTIQPIAGGKATKLKYEAFELNEIMFTPDGKHMLVLTYGSVGKMMFGESKPQLEIYATGKGYRRVGKLVFSGASKRFTAMSISPDGRHVVLGSQDGYIWVADLPSLKTHRRITNDGSCGHVNAGNMAFSPDGKLLLVGARYGPIRLFNVDGFKVINTSPAHQGDVTDAYFSAKGDMLRTIGEYGFVCLWDSTTLKLRKRFTLPGKTRVVAVRPPDGRYALCAVANQADTSVLDLDNGKVISTLNLPVHWEYNSTSVRWRARNQIDVTDQNMWRRIDYRTGKVLVRRDRDTRSDSDLYNGRGYLTENGKQIFLWNRTGGRGSTRWIEVWTIDAETGKASEKVEIEQIIRGGYNDSGLVPGGKYFYCADPDMYILNRKTGKLVSHRSFGDTDILKVSFSPNGDRYAMVRGGRIFVDASLRIWDPETTSMVSIHETLTGKTLQAFPAPDRWVGALRFSPDGKKLLVSCKNIVEIWPVLKAP
ncbi:MAG: WD40 repeat domain-containing protein [Phycisphaerales bacterium]|jgi:WD40 repeat protein|nr:WD40 repeat domain-containing protein [Phycisphaerales bacterium]